MTTSIYGPPPDKDPRAKRGDGAARPRGVLATLGLICLGVGCFVALVWLEGPGGSDGPDIDQILRMQQRLDMPQLQVADFTHLDLAAFKPLQTATLIPSSAIHPAAIHPATIHPAEATGAASTRTSSKKPLQSAGIILRR